MFVCVCVCVWYIQFNCLENDRRFKHKHKRTHNCCPSICEWMQFMGGVCACCGRAGWVGLVWFGLWCACVFRVIFACDSFVRFQCVCVCVMLLLFLSCFFFVIFINKILSTKNKEQFFYSKTYTINFLWVFFFFFI